MAHIDTQPEPGASHGKSLDRHPHDMAPDDPYLHPEIRDATLAASERRSAALDATGGALNEWNEQNAERVAAVRAAEAKRQADRDARRVAGRTITDPVEAVNALHKLIRSARSGPEREPLPGRVELPGMSTSVTCLRG